MATDIVQCSHYRGSLEKVLVINRCKTRMIGNNVLLPLFNERQCERFLYLLQQAVYEPRQLCKSVVALICCSGKMNEIIGNWNKNMCYRQGDIDCAHQSLPTMYIFHPETNAESPWSITSVFPGGTKRRPPPPWKRKKFIGLLTDFKKEMQQTELHACHLVHVEVPVNSLLLKYNMAQLRRVRKSRQHDRTRERPYHKTIPVVFASRLLQKGDNQGLDAYDVGNDVH